MQFKKLYFSSKTVIDTGAECTTNSNEKRMTVLADGLQAPNYRTTVRDISLAPGLVLLEIMKMVQLCLYFRMGHHQIEHLPPIAFLRC